MNPKISITCPEDIVRRSICSGPYMTAAILSFVGCLFGFFVDGNMLCDTVTQVFASDNIELVPALKYSFMLFLRIIILAMGCIMFANMLSARRFWKTNGSLGNKNGLAIAVNSAGVSLPAWVLYVAFFFIGRLSSALHTAIWAIGLLCGIAFAVVYWISIRKIADYIILGDSTASDLFVIIASFIRLATAVLLIVLAVIMIMIALVEFLVFGLFYIFYGAPEGTFIGHLEYAGAALASIPSTLAYIFYLVLLFRFRNDKSKLKKTEEFKNGFN